LRPSSSKRKTQEEIAAALPSKEKLDAFRALIHQAKAGTLTVSSEVSEVRHPLLTHLACLQVILPC
jgi:hypothetical protein